MSKRKREEMGEYELIRQARIEENRKRMQELGLGALKESMSADIATKKRRPPPTPAVVRPSGPSRRSARLQSCPAPCYRDVQERSSSPSERRSRRSGRLAGTGGPIPEVYTQEHEKLLGCAKEEWQLFVDGYNGGERIYDAFSGKTCHQCRQKTVGLRTFCYECESLHGQFCGDCLFMRYGENVKEALADKSWKCPVCRGICNCSICRTRKGWAPTGNLYRTALRMGYKSVAHFLILTRRGGEEGKEIELADDVVKDRELESEDEDVIKDESKSIRKTTQAKKKNQKARARAKKKVATQDTGSSEDEAPVKRELRYGGDEDRVILVISDSEEDGEECNRQQPVVAVKQERQTQHIAARLRSRRVQPSRVC
ncbi:cell division cycle-associated 7-like protein [Selaginella moellendorffii]|uniref:cell division cycle-associated 7-like protein n=1 Tax=Selaginella moellendorffii TaxID=88036 RepID=UPI000D1C4B45|nr:cell division cycle-associated 7-like protein [Selaginella moellendorffii]|eukprot:XP_024521599.1 cell division cycle-associated 7-like protein [Selaginella moellendorffii]